MSSSIDTSSIYNLLILFLFKHKHTYVYNLSQESYAMSPYSKMGRIIVLQMVIAVLVSK